MTPHPDPADMENDPQLAALYRAAANAQPPAHLDDAIRAAARREVAAGPRRAGIRRWTLPVSLAAVIVLSVSMVTMMREQGADRPESFVQAPQTPAVTVQRESDEARASTAPAAEPRRKPAPPPAVTDSVSAKTEAPEPAAVLSDRAAAVEQGPGESAAKAAAAANRAEEPVAARRDYAAPQPLQRSAPASMAAEMSGSTGGLSAARPSASPPAFSAAPAKSALWQDLSEAPPDKWIQRLIEWRRAGRTADAEALLTEFRRRFPELPVPEAAR